MPKPPRAADYEDEPSTVVVVPRPYRHDPKALTYRFDDDEPAEREGAQRA